MQVDSINISNFAGIEKLKISLNGQETHIYGVNGSGKTTVGMTAIWACIKGIAEKNTSGQLIGSRFRFIKDSSHADIEVTCIDEKRNNAKIIFKNTITPEKNIITVIPPAGYELTILQLQEMFSMMFMSAKHFCSLSSKEQALALGIDVTSFDQRMKVLKDEFTLINRDIKNIGELKEVPKVERVDVSQLVRELTLANEFNRSIDKEIEESNNNTARMTEIVALMKNLRAEYDSLSTKEAGRVISVKKDVDSINEKINSASTINDNATLYDQYCEKKKVLDIKTSSLNKNKEDQQKVLNERIAYIQSKNLPFDNLSINEDGGLLMNGRPIAEPYFSQGERELIVAKLQSSINQEWKYRFIDDFDLMDEVKGKEMIDTLIEAGYQLLIAHVHQDIWTTSNNIIIEKCKI